MYEEGVVGDTGSVGSASDYEESDNATGGDGDGSQELVQERRRKSYKGFKSLTKKKNSKKKSKSSSSTRSSSGLSELKDFLNTSIRKHRTIEFYCDDDSCFIASITKKSNKFDKLGITFTTKDIKQQGVVIIPNAVVIQQVNTTTTKKTDLVPGLQVLKINGKSITTPEDAKNVCNETPVGEIVSILVQGTVLKAKKKMMSLFKQQKVGLSLRCYTEDGLEQQDQHQDDDDDQGVVGDDEYGDDGGATSTSVSEIVISSVDTKHGLFPTVKRGSILHAVNGVLTTDFKETLRILKSNRSLTLIVLNPVSPSFPPRISTSQQQQQQQQQTTKQKEQKQQQKQRIQVPSTNFKTTIVIEQNNAAEQQQHHHQTNNIPLRVVACVIRENISVPIGLTFHQDFDSGCLVIDSVSARGLFAYTGLQSKQKIVKINGHVTNHVTEQNLDRAVQMLLHSKGRLTIEAESVQQHPSNNNNDNNNNMIERQIYCIQKTSKQFQLGVGLEQVVPSSSTTTTGDNNPYVKISNVSPTMEKVLGITRGLRLLRINGVRCNPTNLPSVQGQMERAFPMLTLECLSNLNEINNNNNNNNNVISGFLPQNDNVRVVACVIRPSADVGIGFSYHPDVEKGCLIIDNVMPHGLFAHTGLQPNQKIVKINGHSYNRISKQKLDAAVHLLRNTSGRITIEAKSLSLTPTVERQIFSIQKASKEMKLGLGLERTKTNNNNNNNNNNSVQGWTISNVSPTLEKVLGLNQGLQLLKVNGYPCYNLSIEAVNKRMDDSFPMLSLECQAPGNTSGQQQQQQQQQTSQKQSTPELSEKEKALLAKEFAIAERALPVPVNENNKATAKIVRTVTVELKRELVKAQLPKAKVNNVLGLSLARHQHLNAIVITDISKDSLLAKQVKIGQVFVSINHISCPYTTQSTVRMVQRKANENEFLRIEAGDVEHVDVDGFGHQLQTPSHSSSHKNSTLSSSVNEDEAKMMKAIRMGMQRASEHGDVEEEVVPIIRDDDDDWVEPDMHHDIEIERDPIDEDELMGIFSA